LDASSHRLEIIVLLLGCWLSAAWADMSPPQTIIIADSASTQLNQGVEYSRLSHYFGQQQQWKGGWAARTTGRWRTDWQDQRGSEQRMRQEGDWYFGVAKSVHDRISIWAAGQGEHFDDRPSDHRALSVIRASLLPRDLALPASETMFSTETASATRILRGGAGVSVRPYAPLLIYSAAGVVDDRRIGQQVTGFGSWSAVKLDQWESGGFRHDGSLDFRHESPANHYSMDLKGDYGLYREFFPGNTNRAHISAGLIESDVYRGPLIPSSRRREQRFLFEDDLEYEIADRVSIQMSGDFQRETTDLGTESSSGSELKEQQAGLSASIKGSYRQSTGLLTAGIRSVSQTIRGDILLGRKSELSFLGTTVLPDQSTLGLRMAVSKYVLDTPSDRNTDDRDELGFRIESTWTRVFFGSIVYELRTLANLDHLVYILADKSSNNRWTRLFLLGSRIRHQPVPFLLQEFRFIVSANYQAYDFEFNPRTIRSTVFRRFIASDSVNVSMTDKISLNAVLGYQIEELGRLFWEEFEEARSDETRSWNLAAILNRKMTRSMSLGGGYMWNRRIGDQFANSDEGLRERFQDLNSYGPILSISHQPATGFFLSGSGRALQQFELNQNARWIISGIITGGIRW
jgi:hypothetical protein